jgi:pimeloyl-ACP methyl ester carboxylesterase
MGFGDTNKTVIGIVLAQAFPLKPIQNWAFNWAFGTEPKVRESFREWFWLVLNGAMPKATMPTSFTADQIQKINVPVLAFFGARDGVIGDAKKAKTLAENIPDVRVEIVDSGHLIGVELPDIVNQAMLEFFDE